MLQCYIFPSLGALNFQLNRSGGIFFSEVSLRFLYGFSQYSLSILLASSQFFLVMLRETAGSVREMLRQWYFKAYRRRFSPRPYTHSIFTPIVDYRALKQPLSIMRHQPGNLKGKAVDRNKTRPLSRLYSYMF